MHIDIDFFEDVDFPEGEGGAQDMIPDWEWDSYWLALMHGDEDAASAEWRELEERYGAEHSAFSSERDRVAAWRRRQRKEVEP